MLISTPQLRSYYFFFSPAFDKTKTQEKDSEEKTKNAKKKKISRFLLSGFFLTILKKKKKKTLFARMRNIVRIQIARETVDASAVVAAAAAVATAPRIFPIFFFPDIFLHTYTHNSFERKKKKKGRER